MVWNNKMYAKWETDMEQYLDDLVVKNYFRLYNADIQEYDKIWGEISNELNQKYDLLGLAPDQPEYEIKRKKQNSIFINIRLYSEKEFPWELLNKKTYNFVRLYNKLPKQAPKEWRDYQLKNLSGNSKYEGLDAFRSYLKDYREF